MKLLARIIWFILWTVCVAEVKHCDFPQIKHGHLVVKERNSAYFPVPIGKQYIYYCNDGFTVTPESHFGKIQCTAEGWMPKVPCLKQCIFHSLENGRSPYQETSYVQDESVKVYCYPGYSLPNGQNTITCTEDGWSPLPKCVRMKTCSKFDIEIENGFLSEPGYVYALNKKTQYRCKQGYVTASGETSGFITCLQNGWSAQPSCVKSCDMPVFENAKTKNSGTWFKLNDKVDYECSVGYENRHKQRKGSITCTYAGWSDTPSCYVKRCDFPQMEHGYLFIKEKESLYFQAPIGKQYDYYCYNGFVATPTSRFGKIQCTAEGWTPEVPCLKTCSKFDIEIENGFLSEPGNVYALNQKTQYRCKQGYVTASGETSGSITCLQTGWSAQPSCIKSCDMPIFENAKTKHNGTWFTLNDKVDYECSAGYENRHKQRKGSITCTYAGWSDTPSCYERECLIPKIEQQLVVDPRKEKYKIGDVLKFACRNGLKRVGPDSVQCYHFGWSPKFPVCKGQVEPCGQPPELLNGEVRGTRKEYGHGDVAEYNCNLRFVLKGPNKIQCVDGKWTTLPTCIEEEKVCVDIPELEHGDAQRSAPPYRHGDSVEFNCIENFTMIGRRSISCISGRWTQLPQCVATDQLEKCKAPRSATLYGNQSNKNEFRHNFNMSYRCRGKSEYEYSTCINGRWDPEPTCTKIEKKSCPPPPQIPNAQVMMSTVKYWDGEKISVLCKENYIIMETEEMVCKDGKWQSLPRCAEKISCSQPPEINHGTIKSPRSSEEWRETFESRIHEHGTKFSYICDDGFRISGENVITCHMGKWSPPPQCVDSTGKCGPPPPIDNGDITSFPLPMYAPASSVEYQCQSLYQLQGSKTITCRNGEWSEPPKCLNPCTISEEIMGEHNIRFKWIGRQKLYAQSGEVVEFVCKYGYYHDQKSNPLHTLCTDGQIKYPTCN